MAGATNPLRQQMINMMYLVLTALLALNVSADILKAFALVNGAIQKTNTAYESRNGLAMQQFQKAYNDDPERAKLVYANAQQAVKLSDDMFGYIQGLKEEIAKMSDGWADESKATVHQDANLEVGTNFMVNKKHASDLKKKYGEYLQNMQKLLIDPTGAPTPSAVNIDMNVLSDPPKAKDGTKRTWEEYYFEGVPSVAALTELTKFQNEVRNTQGEVIQYLQKQVGANTIKIDAYIPVVSSSTPAVYSGDKYTADISLGAINKTQQFEAYVNGSPVTVKDGVAHFETTGSGIGEKTLNVVVKYKDPKGETKTLNTETKYNVFTGSATISATKMNMLYIGLDNPISVSVPGFRPDQVQVGATSGLNLRKEGDHWVCKPSQGTREGTLTVTADGKRVGSMNYRVRPVPKPEILFGTKTGGAMSRGELMTVQYVNAGLGASFAFEGLNYKVTRYTLVFAPRHGEAKFFPVNGNTIPGDARAVLNNAHPGDMVIISAVTAVGPSGTVNTDGPTLTIQ